VNLLEPVPVGVCAIPRIADMVLLGKRRGAHAAGMYAVPGGKPDPGESPEQTARRELQEEAGLVVAQMWPVGRWVYNRFEDEGVHYVTLFYEVKPLDPASFVTREPEKCEGWAWWPLDALPGPLWPGLADVLGGLRR
jgi:8-oxo-dGTP diphosphatase